MNKVALKLMLLCAGVAIIGGTGTAWAGPPASGHWEGTISISEHPFNIIVDLAPDSLGAWSGSMSVLKSTSIDVPLASVAVDGKTIRFLATLPEAALFQGQLSEDNRSISGTAANSEGEAPFTLALKGEASVKVPPPSSRLSNEFVGDWEGVLEGKRVGLKLNRASDGIAIGKLIADSGLEIPVSTVTISGQQLELESRAISGRFSGALTGGEIAGVWTQGRAQIPVSFKRASR
jgi:hypothetical protein